MMLTLVVGTAEIGEYKTIASAILSLSGTAPACFTIYQGTYAENFTVSYGWPLTVYGYTTEYVRKTPTSRLLAYVQVLETISIIPSQ